MLGRNRFGAVLSLALVVAGCKGRADAQRELERVRAEQAKGLMQTAQAQLAEDHFGAAGDAAQKAANLSRNDPQPYMLLFEIRRAEGNGSAAVLALKMAVDLNPTLELTLKSQLAQMYEDDGRWSDAIVVLKELERSGRLNAAALCHLASLEARVGDGASALKTLEQVQEANPDDLQSKVAEAEALLAKKDDALALKLLDRLIEEHPDLNEARVVRARYSMQREYADRAFADVSKIQGDAALEPEVALLKASVLGRRNQLSEAERVLKEALVRRPKNVLLLSRLGEVQLDQKQIDDAEENIERALALRPSSTIARYVRGRAAEMRGDTQQAIKIYQDVLVNDPSSAPATSHLWPLLRAQGQRNDAQELLERLVSQNQASIGEKVSLAEMYDETRTQDAKALKLMDEALEREPRNADYVRLRAKIAARVHKKRANGIVILKTRRH